ncbi:MAG: site-specific integrase [Synergistaceae bacterium]|nr:site-specific integrase [Synergistaceae bacterium]
MRLTQKVVNGIKPNGKAQWFLDDGLKGLRLYVGAKNNRSWSLRYRDRDGVRKSHTLGDAAALTVEQARDSAKHFLANLAVGKDLHVKEKLERKMTLGEYIEKNYATRYRPSKHTLWRLAAHFKEKFWNRPTDSITVKDIQIWRNRRLDEGTKAATINKDCGALIAALNKAECDEIIKENPLKKLRRLPEEGVSDEADSKEIIRYLSDDERSRLYDAMDAREDRIRIARNISDAATFADHIKPMVIVSLTSGIRRGSLFGLLWSDIDFDHNTLTLRPSNVKSKKKTVLPMSTDTRETLLLWREQTNNDGLVFPSPVTGSMLTNVKKAWTGILKDAQIDNFRWHDMRHDFASQLVMRGVDLYRVQKLMGHRDISMTQRYAHFELSVLQEAIDILDSTPGKIIGRISASA